VSLVVLRDVAIQCTRGVKQRVPASKGDEVMRGDKGCSGQQHGLQLQVVVLRDVAVQHM
jgi:hypothetical protein